MENNIISLADAQARIGNLQTSQTDIQKALTANPDLINNPVLNIHAFTMKLVELENLLERINLYNSESANESNPINAIRFYLAETEPQNHPIPPYASLIAVSVS